MKIEEVTERLTEISNGSQEAYNKLFPVVYDRLRHLAYTQIGRISASPAEHTWSKTGLVHEVYLKMVRHDQIDWKGRTHFFAVASHSMRQILIDHARKMSRQKRGGDKKEITFIDEIMKAEFQAEELIQIDGALNKLNDYDERLAKIVELRFFGEMNFEDIAEVMNLSPRTVYRDWAVARGWLYKELKKQLI
ncbi:sigma-70 family RNA polymerase sigma factor [Rhodohalobacter sp. 614A]|uniref:sigma-70 family RNA polymerase sigma factor n=1 Tax=Rhodohalobacter sp. 614A TaxID=2908649 RepID=UPI001F391206|nr:sigma-70 family RNA polymerase sigma factor [Rhodohalobacter sp. 614A]